MTVTVGEDLASTLRREVDGEVRFDTSSRALWASDASNYRIVPLGVVLPRSKEGLIAAVATCAAHGVAVIARGGGTSTGGQAVGPGVVIDCSRYLDHVVSIDPERRLATVEPGIILDSLQKVARAHGLAFGPDPSTHDRCTLGGMIGNNACGAHSLRFGKTDDNVESLEVLTYDGTRLLAGAGLSGGDSPAAAAIESSLSRLVATYGEDLRRAFAPVLPRRVSGYGLQHLLPEHGPNLARALVGTEGTCVSLLEATVRLVRLPPVRALVVLAFPDVYAAASFVPTLLPLEPLTIEGIDQRVVALSEAAGRRGSNELLGEGGAWLLVEVGGDSTAEAEAEGRRLVENLRDSLTPGSARVVGELLEQRAIWRIREDGAGLATRLPGGGEAFPGFEDAAVPPEQLASYLKGFDALLADHGRRGVHYGHYGEGCVHIRVDFDFRSERGVSDFRRFIEDGADLVVAHGGSLSGEHGDGQARSELLHKMYPPSVLQAFGAFKAAFDPTSAMNPGRIVEARPIDADLRITPKPFAISPRTTLALSHDGGDLGAATRRCVGVGRCRRIDGGGMCPSYQVTRDEAHSTRGRARLLAEMLDGEVIRDGWQSSEVAEALDLCLACKACKSDCPVGVDMAAYKAEFLSRHYRRRLRPASHYSLGFLPLWARLGSLAPRLASALATSPRLRALRRLGGVDPTRVLPGLARRSFRAASRDYSAAPPPSGVVREKVLLFPDTFSNFFEPQVASGAREVLEAAGYEVVLPEGPVCCGLTWYTTGQFKMARRVLRRTLRSLGVALEDGMRVVTMEPSCASMLAEDAPELFGEPRHRNLREAAERLAGRVVSFGALLADGAPEGLSLEGAVYAQVHCHEQAGSGFAREAALLGALGASLRTSTGCCGLAGNFGIETEHREVSEAVARAGVLDALSHGVAGEVVLADGFSCRTQIRGLSGRDARHLAEVLAEQLHRAKAPELEQEL